MKVYTYSLADLNYPGQPAATLRFDRSEPVGRPEDAEVIIVPATLQDLKRSGIDVNGLRHLSAGIHKHVFLDISDDFRTFPKLADAIFLRASLTEHMRAVNPRSLCLPWPCPGTKYAHGYEPMGVRPRKLVSFRGWSSSGITRAAIESVLQVFGSFRCDIVPNAHHIAAMGGQEVQDKLFAAHLASMRDCMICLCPSSITMTEGYCLGADRLTLERDYQGIPAGTTPESSGYIYPGGNLRYRMYEAMAVGRVPFVVSSGHVLPRPDKIRWNEVAFFAEESDVARTGERILQIIRREGLSGLHDRGQEGRRMFQQHLDADQWERIFREMVEEEVGRWTRR